MYKQIEGTEIIDVLNGVIKTVEGLKERVEADLKASTTVEEIIEHEGLKLKRVDREAREGDYVRVQHKDGECFIPNKIYGPVSNRVVKADSSTGRTEYEITDVYNEFYGRTPSTVEVFEVVDVLDEKLPFPKIVEEKPKLTANQQRALVIKEAKHFIASKVKDGIVKIGEKNYKVHFNRKGKTISCILNDLETGYTTFVNKVNCHPQDVFNEHIGQAIALGGIIGTPKKMFLKAVQPDEVVVGMIVESSDGYEHGNGTVERFEDSPFASGYWTIENGFNYLKHASILDDTNAEYSNE